MMHSRLEGGFPLSQQPEYSEQNEEEIGKRDGSRSQKTSWEKNLDFITRAM